MVDMDYPWKSHVDTYTANAPVTVGETSGTSA